MTAMNVTKCLKLDNTLHALAPKKGMDGRSAASRILDAVGPLARVLDEHQASPTQAFKYIGNTHANIATERGNGSYNT